MPHLSPMKWLFMYLFMIMWTMILIIQMNFFFLPKPIIKNMKIITKSKNWQI